MKSDVNGPLISTGTAEEKLLIHLATLAGDRDWNATAEHLLDVPLDWHWIAMQAAKHKVLQLVWDNLKQHDLAAKAIRDSRLPKLLTIYFEQLHLLNRRRNTIFLKTAQKLFEDLEKAEIEAVCLKGGALIGTLYSPGNRMLHDIDILIRNEDRNACLSLLEETGFQQGYFNYSTQKIEPMEERQRRFWIFQNHTLPPFFKETGEPDAPWFKLSVGFDLFDQGEPYSMPNGQIVDRRTPKGDGTAIQVPSRQDMLINLCAHIYREGVSAVFARNSDNWQLTKFCDLVSVLKTLDPGTSSAFLDEVRDKGLSDPVYFALKHAEIIYGPDTVPDLASALTPSDAGILFRLADGQNLGYTDIPFKERLFETFSARSTELKPKWYAEFSDDEW